MPALIFLCAIAVLVGSIMGLIKARSGPVRVVCGLAVGVIVVWYFGQAVKLASDRSFAPAAYRAGLASQ